LEPYRGVVASGGSGRVPHGRYHLRIQWTLPNRLRVCECSAQARGIRRFEVRTGGAAASFRVHTRRLYTIVHRTTISNAPPPFITLARILRRRRFDPR
jgi:hypothetical protein